MSESQIMPTDGDDLATTIANADYRGADERVSEYGEATGESRPGRVHDGFVR